MEAVSASASATYA